MIAAVILVMGLKAPLSTYKVLSLEIQKDPYKAIVDDHGIADERQSYYMFTGLLHAKSAEVMPDHYLRTMGEDARESGKKVIDHINVGIFGFYAGPNVYILDRYALGDPLLARLPALYNECWRIGHFERAVPKGYFESLENNDNQIENPWLSQYYDKLLIITRGELFDPERLLTIVKINLGQYDHLIDFERFRYYNMDMTTLDKINYPKPEGKPSNNPDNIHLSVSGVEIELNEIAHHRILETTLDNNDDYRSVYLQEGEILNTQVVEACHSNDGLAHHRLEIPEDVADHGFDCLRIFPVSGDNDYYLGHISLQEK